MTFGLIKSRPREKLRTTAIATVHKLTASLGETGPCILPTRFSRVALILTPLPLGQIGSRNMTESLGPCGIHGLCEDVTPNAAEVMALQEPLKTWEAGLCAELAWACDAPWAPRAEQESSVACAFAMPHPELGFLCHVD